MCKIVYLTTKRFNSAPNHFKNALAKELRSRGVNVITDYSYDLLNMFRKHKTYGIALAFDFYKDNKEGCGLTLNKNSSYISRDFAYNLSNQLDRLTPDIHWRDFNFVESENEEWYKFFNKVSSSTKAIFYLCTINNKKDFENYSIGFNRIIKSFSDEIIRCLRSNYDAENYRKRVKIARLQIRKNFNNGLD